MGGLYDSYDWWCLSLGICHLGGTPHRREDCERYHEVHNPMRGLCWQGGVLHRREDCERVHGMRDRREVR